MTRDLYAAAAAHWAIAGARLHLVRVPAIGELLDPWYRLGFGQMQLDAIRQSGATPGPVPAGVAIRRGGSDDLDAVAPLAGLIWELQAASPAFTGLAPPAADELRADWLETLTEPDVAFFVAERDDRTVGHALLYPPDPDFALAPDSVRLAVMAVMPAERGAGIGLALTEHVLAWARSAGYATVVTDWRVPNLLASRFWPARGFRSTFHRLHRVVEVG